MAAEHRCLIGTDNQSTELQIVTLISLTNASVSNFTKETLLRRDALCMQFSVLAKKQFDTFVCMMCSLAVNINHVVEFR